MALTVRVWRPTSFTRTGKDRPFTLPGASSTVALVLPVGVYHGADSRLTLTVCASSS